MKLLRNVLIPNVFFGIANKIKKIRLLSHKFMWQYLILSLIGVLPFFTAQAQESSQASQINELVKDVKSDVIKWRRHIHQNPELSNREFKTAKYIEEHLKKLGLDVQTGVAHTGVVAILDTGKPGPTVALRADIDALPMLEKSGLPYASKVMAQYNDKEVSVAHTCGHDAHAAMLMGAAEVLVKAKEQLKGKVMFIFQPAEEGAPHGEEGGARLMVKENVLKGVDVIFGLHIDSQIDTGMIAYRPAGIMAAADAFKITIKGKGAHGAAPWSSQDPIVTAGQMIMSLQTVVSRELKLLDDAAVLSIGSIQGGNRSNIIPSEVEIVGTLRTLDEDMRSKAIAAIQRKVKGIADSMNVIAEVKIPDGINYPITYNPPKLMTQMLPTLKRTTDEENVFLTKALLASEDFSFFQEKVPGLYLFVGGKDRKMPMSEAPAHHTPDFVIDDSGLDVGVKLYSNLTIDYMAKK